MTSEQKKAFLLLESIIFHYHGLDESEQQMLAETAGRMQAEEELEWVTEFIASDTYTAFERARAFLNNLAQNWDNETKLSYLERVWKATHQKGHVTEMEATAMLKFAKDWQIQRELLTLIRKK